MTEPCPVCLQTDWAESQRANGNARRDCRQCSRERTRNRKHRTTQSPGEIDWLEESEPPEDGEDVDALFQTNQTAQSGQETP